MCFCHKYFVVQVYVVLHVQILCSNLQHAATAVGLCWGSDSSTHWPWLGLNIGGTEPVGDVWRLCSTRVQTVFGCCCCYGSYQDVNINTRVFWCTLFCFGGQARKQRDNYCTVRSVRHWPSWFWPEMKRESGHGAAGGEQTEQSTNPRTIHRPHGERRSCNCNAVNL